MLMNKIPSLLNPDRFGFAALESKGFLFHLFLWRKRIQARGRRSPFLANRWPDLAQRKSRRGKRSSAGARLETASHSLGGLTIIRRKPMITPFARCSYGYSDCVCQPSVVLVS